MGCTPSRPERPPELALNPPLKSAKGETTPVTSQDTDRQAAAERAQDWTPSDEPWIKPAVVYSIKFFRHDQPCVVIDVCSASEIPKTSDKFSVFCAIEDCAEQPLQRFCFVVHPDNVVMEPASMYNGARQKLCTKAIAASSYHFGEKIDEKFEIIEPEEAELPAPYDIQLPPVSAFEHTKNGVVFSRSRTNMLFTAASFSTAADSTDFVDGDTHGLRPPLIATSMSTDDASPPPLALGRQFSAQKEPAQHLDLQVCCEAELEKYCTDESASYAVLPRAYFESRLLPVLEREAVNDGIADVTSVPGTAAAAAAVGVSVAGGAAGPIFDIYGRYGVPKRKLFITPEQGFVLLCQTTTGITYINVLQHPDVGALIRSSAHTTPTAAHSAAPDRMAVIVSTCTPNVETSKGPATVLDVVVPSSELRTIDGAAVSREEVAKKVLQALQAVDFTIDAEHTLPHVPHDYFPHSGDPAMPTTIGSTMNLTEVEKATYSVLALCKLYKQGHAKRNWRERVALFTDTKVYLFDQNMHLKDDFPMEDTTAELTGTVGPEPKAAARTPTHHRTRSGDYLAATEQPVSTAAPFSAYRPPDGALPFQLRNRSPTAVAGSKDHIAYLATPTMEVMDCLWEMLRVRDSHVAALSTMLNIPAAKAGWLEREGHMVKGWKSRFFMLSYGVLEYSKKPIPSVSVLKRHLQQQGTGLASVSCDALGNVVLNGATVTKGKTSPRMGPGPYRLTIQDKKGSRLVLQMKTAQDLEEWFDAFQRHIEYATRHFK